MELMKWSTPERRDGNRNLSIIPNEIYLEVFDHFQIPLDVTEPEYKTILSNLCLVCRFFHSVCLPRLFKQLNISMETPSRWTWFNDLRKGDLWSTEIGSYVRSCRFHEWNHASREPIPAFWAKMPQTITLLTRLTSLELSNSRISLSIIDTIVGLTSLRKVSIRDSFFDLLPQEHIFPPVHPRLTHFALRGNYDASPYFPIIRACTGPTILHALRTDEWHLVRDFFAEHLDYAVQELYLLGVTEWRAPLQNYVAC
ncbi:hypothetical protein BKA93DRAFT_595671 [Sparassis latifolia]